LTAKGQRQPGGRKWGDRWARGGGEDEENERGKLVGGGFQVYVFQGQQEGKGKERGWCYRKKKRRRVIREDEEREGCRDECERGGTFWPSG
jgi:hypothetical protein